MKLEVKYRDDSGTISNKEIDFPYLALIKHMAVAGQGYVPSLSKMLRCCGMFLIYSSYMELDSINNNHFSIPEGFEYDPTIINHFSNIAGKAIADYLAKKISGAKISYNYEAAMKKNGHLVKGGRPDLLCEKKGEMFAVEAKGYSVHTVSENKMRKHKHQSSTGPIPVKFSIASVAYNIYSHIKVNYYDPNNKDYKYDETLSKELSMQYYAGLLEYVNKNLFNIQDKKIDNNSYYQIPIDYKKNINLLLSYINVPKVYILLDKRIKQFSEKGLDDFKMKTYNEKDIYIDTDGVGIMIE